MTVLGDIIQAVFELFVEGFAELIHRRFGMIGCLITGAVIVMIVGLLIWWVVW